MDAKIDILGLGCTAIDELLYVDAYPAADGKMQVRRRQRQCGGLTATALVAAARWDAAAPTREPWATTSYRSSSSSGSAKKGSTTPHSRQARRAADPLGSIIVDESRHTRAILFDTDGVFGPIRLGRPKS